MTKQRLYLFIIVGLLISNVLLLALPSINKPPHKHQKPRDIIIEKLAFSEEQTKKYDALIIDHRSKIERKQTELRSLKQRLYLTLTAPENAIDSEKLFQGIAQTQAQIERIHYLHFEDIRAICTPEQLTSFNELSKELAKLFAPMPTPKKH